MLEESTEKAFEDCRNHLLAVAYRLTGSIADAEDAVQDAWLRLAGADVAAIRDLRAWLTTVVGRLCLDKLRSAAVRRETYVGQWLPEPVVAPLGSVSPPDPLDEIVQHEDNRLAALVVLDSLTPAQRVAFVLHDAFDVPFDDIARVLDIATPTARQLASRARRVVSSAPPPSSPDAHEEAVGRLIAAFAAADLDAIVAALHPEARMIGDAGGTTRTALNVVVGAEKVARFFLGLLRLYGTEELTTFEPVRVNGELGLLNRGRPAADDRPGFPPRVTAWTVRDGRVWTAYDMANPQKLRRGILLSDKIFE
ncbi:RNA polymerase sigma factor SigJ [Rhodococcus sp. NPDC047139]|uniref:RNA polymerase sigma factor SigJ n=1 Tax=Rhodococcus sp. NPDC047139 TaxID=3155141 RepID=UPI0033D9DA18